MSRRGRPTVGERISVRLPASLLEELDERASALQVTRAEVIRLLLSSALQASGSYGVDRSQIARRLRLTPAERLRTMAEETRKLQALGQRVS